MNEPLRDIMGTFFGKIQNVPKDYLIRTLQSHDQEHCECPEHSWAGTTAKKLVGNILNALMVYQVGFSQVHCPCPYSVFTMSWVRKLVFVPSDGSLVAFHKNQLDRRADDMPMNDTALYHLINVGVRDMDAIDKPWDASTRSMRYAACLGDRLWTMITREQNRVCVFCFFVLLRN